MSKKSQAIAARVQVFVGGDLDPHYACYFDCFDRQLFYEAHDVLEELWLPRRREPEGDFYKGLIQLAGAFVHVQKLRPQPAVALLDLARANLEKYAPEYCGLQIANILGAITEWRIAIRRYGGLRLVSDAVPQLRSFLNHTR